MEIIKQVEKIIEAAEQIEENFPGERDDYRRQRIVKLAVQTADSIIMASPGSTEELDFLTAEVAEAFLQKVSASIRSKLQRKELMGRGSSGRS